ncbi:MAG: Putative serine/threonine protein kinase [uncultured Blastococcus sp.]|uniref:non-specific serine/threonine protein kinase n=1 Tax=uncultured Blastococcus sp. TaxID=217144 RepID=A0A6J4JEL0_9ACTN|nr:MAG: Putative serine/threonine protein kinase [uncultured Blastococcus sp.]
MTRPVTTPGRLVAGRYRLQSQLGGGGMGTVWLARDELLGRPVAIKQVLTAVGVSEAEADQQRQRALREGRIAARLSHPHAISVYDVALESGQPWLVMEYLPSRSLAEVLTGDGVLRADQVAQIGAQVGDALAATHAAGIVHRDVKPANILIGEGGRVDGLVKITDFGISHASGDVTLTQTGQITGTPAFLAPEVAQGREMNEASDVFSLGATLYTCIEGQPPFGMEDNALAMLHKVAAGQVVPPRRAGPLTGALTSMLAADPADRPTMPQIRDELARLAAGRGGDTTTVLLARTDIRPGEGRNRTAALPADLGSNGDRSSAGATPPAGGVSPPTLTSPAGPAVSATPSTPPPAAPARVPAQPAAVPPQDRGRRRGRLLWLLAGLVAVVVAGLITWWTIALDGDGNDPSDAAPGTSASTEATSEPTTEPSSAPTTTAEEPAPETSEPVPTSAPEPAPADDPAQAVTAIFGSIPGDLEAAYAQTSPGFQSRFSFANFSGFWDDFSDVQIGNVVAESGTTALVDITYVRPDGSSETESHRVSFVAGDDGRLLLESDLPA